MPPAPPTPAKKMAKNKGKPVAAAKKATPPVASAPKKSSPLANADAEIIHTNTVYPMKQKDEIRVLTSTDPQYPAMACVNLLNIDGKPVTIEEWNKMKNGMIQLVN